MELIQSVKPELIFMDIQMPFMNGLEILEQVKDANVIIITAYDSFEHAQKALRLGACDILAKPIDFEQLHQAIERCTGWKFTDNDIVNTIIEYIYKNYAEPISLKELAEMVNCSDSHISHLFKKHMKISIVSYIHQVRIEKSKELLEQGESVKEAAVLTGYQNINHFYKYFKDLAGCTPAQYLQNSIQKI